ncbi:sensor histidine kinase [Geomonas subterranea]|uniref:histidine kinase n=1 Tax=Geomonas subterranea TaxID=2847989 RepID=A0ABX8LLM3_9BACT|nr:MULTISPECIES: PAS domain S-box protein [Geomonas]QXE92593.1 PAS domain S-box protein [Geomonas subterranea]QXM09308.1 PAS domain S-box protein [Geomonas subterranea]
MKDDVTTGGDLQAEVARLQAENDALRRIVKEHQEALEGQDQAHRCFRCLYNDTPVMLHSIDRDGLLLGVSNYWTEVLGYTREEVLGRRSSDFLTPRSRRYAVETVLPEFFRTGYCRNVEYQLVKKNGDVIDVLLSAAAERDAAGDIVRSMAVMIDVSEWKAAEKALKESESRYRMIVETSQESIVAADPAGRLVYLNRQFAEMLGREVHEVLGHPFLEFVDEALHEETAARQRSRKNGVSEHYETIMVRKDGNRVWVSVSAKPIHDQDGTFAGSFAMISDVTRRKQAAEEIEVLHTHLSARALELETANEELEAFNYTVSHDLRRPLTAIYGFAQVINELYGERLEPQCRDYVQEIINGSIKMNHLIDTLLNFSRRYSAALNREQVDLSGLALEILAELRLSDPQRRAECVVQPGVSAHADPQLLRVVLDNLLGNAWKYSAKKDESRLEFGTVEHQGREAFFVRDNGAGFDMEQASSLFKPFQRLHDADDFKGTGIGLASVQRIIQRHGGHIWAEAAPGNGATFYFTLG